MAKKPDEVTTRHGSGILRVNDGREIPVDVTLTTTKREYQIRGRLIVNFEALRASGDLEADALWTLEKGYPNGVILFMGVSDVSFGGKTVCIGIKTGDHVYPMNMFFITKHTMLKACKPVDEPPVEVKPY